MKFHIAYEEKHILLLREEGTSENTKHFITYIDDRYKTIAQATILAPPTNTAIL